MEVEENDEDPPSDQEDGISGFGGGKPQGQEKPVPKRRRTKGPDNTLQSTSASATPAPAPVTGGASTGSQPSAPAKRKSGGQDAELAGLIKTAQSSCTSIRAVSPLLVYQGSIKIKEVDKRLGLATNTLALLEEHVLTSAPAQEASENLSKACRACTDYMDVLVPFTDATEVVLAHVNGMAESDIAAFAKVLPADCCHSVLLDTGKMLLEERVLHGLGMFG